MNGHNTSFLFSWERMYLVDKGRCVRLSIFIILTSYAASLNSRQTRHYIYNNKGPFEEATLDSYFEKWCLQGCVR